MNKIVWRIDSELLTIVEIHTDSLYEDTPLDVWLPVMMGDGSCRYCTRKESAVKLLCNEITNKVEWLSNKIQELMKGNYDDH